jgi:hypothetical protein
MMKYALLYNELPAEVAKANDPAAAEAYWGAWGAYMEAMGPLIQHGAPLAGIETATTLRIVDGRRQVQDGPFATTKELLGGFVVIDVPDLDTALEWAARAPCASAGSVEVRPVGAGPRDQA